MRKPHPTPPRRLDSDLVESFNALDLEGKKAITSKPLPALPRQFDLDESSKVPALQPLAGKKTIKKKLPDPQAGPITQPDDESTFVGGFDPRLLASNTALDSPRHPPLVPSPSAVNRNARTAPPQEAKALPVSPLKRMPMPVPISVPQAGKQSLTLEHAPESLSLNTPTKPALAPHFLTAPPRLPSDTVVSPRVASNPSLTAVTGHSQPALNLTPSRSRVVSAPLLGSNTIQCSGITKVGKCCSRQVKLPATHSRLEPTPALYCHQHKKTMSTAQIGFYVGNTDRFVEFSRYIPKYLQVDTRLALQVEMEKATSRADVEGYIYTFEIRDPKRPDVIQLKVGRAVNINKRLNQWDKQCGSESKEQIPRGYWPYGAGGSLLKGNIEAGEPGPFCHRVERLVHIELTDLSLHTPYLNPGWPDDTFDPATSSPNRKTTAARETTCLDCGVIHREIFAFPRPERGRYKGKEWDLIVKPVIEKWGKFVKEYYTKENYN